MPRSPTAIRTLERYSVLGMPLEKPPFIKRQRVLKSTLFGGNVHIQ